MWGIGKIKFSNVFFLSFLFFGLATSSQAQTSKSNEKAIIKTAIYCEHCKECETCGQTFKSTLYKLSGVRQFDIDQEANTITVYYSPKKVSLDQIRQAISKMGYDADDVKADPEVYAKLDGCCKDKGTEKV
ncbi:heavy-metal-associated domain-containing protein [Flavobacterium sp. HSC-61S13]|uniref:heavy-metal-associated domain-containing protein n=1 Tax=Flavobacterium sp. HSC-61S13 TaxID=2910963 RepID=UPI00209F1358|nr:heavy metal-associated domain-containing protein [Flavobacterium sp. HSC-61S13]MCP1995560.1 copper chaperone CopZ [Flavobacterium sp. HSC-61S13]